MITRFNREHQTTNKNHREQLGEVIAFYRNARGHDIRMVSRVCACSVALVEQWEAGKAVPTSEQWGKLKRAVNGGLREFGDLWRLAADEQHAEHQAMQARRRAEEQNMQNANGASRHVPPTPTIGTNLGSKLASALPTGDRPSDRPTGHWTGGPGQPLTPVHPAAPAPRNPITTVAGPTEPEQTAPVEQPKERKPRKAIPAGSMAAEAIERRRQYVRDLIRKRPGIRGTGPDSINSELLATFGVTMDHGTISELRAEIERERNAALDARAGVTNVIPQTTIDIMNAEQAQRDLDARLKDAPPIIAVAPAQATGDVNEADLAAAVDLILASVPGLQSFTIEVDEQGHATVDYQIRKVVVTTAGGSLKVPRRG